MGPRKNFIISGDDAFNKVTGSKQRINLSKAANVIIKSDIATFSDDASSGKDGKVAGFFNRVFRNFHQDADATPSLRIKKKSEELDAMFSTPEFQSIDADTKKIFKDKFLEQYKQELVTKARSYEKGVIENIRIDSKSLECIREAVEAEHYDGSVGLYLKAIFEEYARKPVFERERIYYKETVDILESAISQKKKVKMSMLKKINPKSKETYTRKFLFTPYKIVQDKACMFNYVIGYSEEFKRDGSGETEDKKITSYRISKIDHITIMSSLSGFMSKADKAAIEEAVMEKDVQFLAGNVESIKVKFTKKGVESFNNQLYMRPTDFEKVDGEENTYIFNCTEVQAINYFFKLARDVEIISPERIRVKFMQRYRDAYVKYAVQDETEKG